MCEPRDMEYFKGLVMCYLSNWLNAETFNQLGNLTGKIGEE